MHEDRDHERGVFQPELHAGAGVPVGQRLGSVEVACWPAGAGKDRKYGGVVHVDVGALSRTRVDEIKGECAAKGVEISALGYCPNPLDDDLVRFAADHNVKIAIEHCPMLWSDT